MSARQPGRTEEDRSHIHRIGLIILHIITTIKLLYYSTVLMKIHLPKLYSSLSDFRPSFSKKGWQCRTSVVDGANPHHPKASTKWFLVGRSQVCHFLAPELDEPMVFCSWCMHTLSLTSISDQPKKCIVFTAFIESSVPSACIPWIILSNGPWRIQSTLVACSCSLSSLLASHSLCTPFLLLLPPHIAFQPGTSKKQHNGIHRMAVASSCHWSACKPIFLPLVRSFVAYSE